MPVIAQLRGTTLNIPLLRKMVEWAETEDLLDEAREWDQTTWLHMETRSGYCDTTMCIAGKVASDAGWKPIFYGDGSASSAQKDGVTEEIRVIAINELGLANAVDSEGNVATWALFEASNCAADIRRIAEDLAGERL